MRIIDLTQEIEEEIQVFPDSPRVKIITWSKHDIHKYLSEAIFTSTHIGTHIDAPLHFNSEGITVAKIPLERVVIENNAKILSIKKNDDEQIEVEDLKKYDIQSGDTIIINTGWSSNRFDEKYYKRNPGLSKDAANYLSKIPINLVGIDSPSIDPANNLEFDSHKILASKNILIVENLINLERISDNNSYMNFTFVALPLRIKNCSGSPIRAIAIVP